MTDLAINLLLYLLLYYSDTDGARPNHVTTDAMPRTCAAENGKRRGCERDICKPKAQEARDVHVRTTEKGRA